MEPDWRLLGAPELLQFISEKLTSIVDFVRFRAVCPAWRCASSPRPRHLPPQLPWLILPRFTYPHRIGMHLDSSLSVYDLSQSKTHTLHLPQIHGNRICGCSHGWLVLEKERQVWLFNPITRDQISLPSLSAPPKFLNEGNTKAALPEPAKWLPYYIDKAILSSNPSLDSDCLVMALFRDYWETAFCRIGDDCWTILTVRDQPRSSVIDIAYYNNLFYAIDYSGKAWKWDIREPFYKIINSPNDNPEEIHYVCTVEGTCDEHGLMMLCQNKSDHIRRHDMFMSGILVLSDDEEIWSNVSKEHTSSYCFFLGGRFHCISLPLGRVQLDGFDGNCICYAYPEAGRRIDGLDWYSCSIKLYKLDDRSVSTLVSHLGFFRLIEFKSRNFLWLTPSLC